MFRRVCRDDLTSAARGLNPRSIVCTIRERLACGFVTQLREIGTMTTGDQNARPILTDSGTPARIFQQSPIAMEYYDAVA